MAQNLNTADLVEFIVRKNKLREDWWALSDRLPDFLKKYIYHDFPIEELKLYMPIFIEDNVIKTLHDAVVAYRKECEFCPEINKLKYLRNMMGYAAFDFGTPLIHEDNVEGVIKARARNVCRGDLEEAPLNCINWSKAIRDFKKEYLKEFMWEGQKYYWK